MLLQHGVKSNAMNHRGETALHVVSRGRYDSKEGFRVARLLLWHGIDVNAEDRDHDSPLHSACYSGKLEIARLLLHHGAKANMKNHRGEIPLHQVSQGKYESQTDGVGIAKLLLDGGLDVNSQAENGATSLHLASWYGKLEIARLLLEYSTSKNNRARTLLHVGVEGEYYLVQERNRVMTLTYLRARHGLERATNGRRNSTPLCLFPREARDRTSASRSWCTSGCKELPRGDPIAPSVTRRLRLSR